MQISIGSITAKCPSCSATEFEPFILSTTGALDTVLCAHCRTKSLHSDLIVQIGDEAIRQAQQNIAAIRKRRGEDF